MKTRIRLALIIAATLPVALSATSINNHNNDYSNRHYRSWHWYFGNGGVFNHRPNQPKLDSGRPVSVPDTASTLLLFGTGLGALVVLRKKFNFQIQ